MPDKRRPRDPNQLAYQIMLESTGQAEKFTPEEKPKNPHAVALGKLGGLKGGPARAAALTPTKRSQIAAKAAAKRWSPAGDQKTPTPPPPKKDSPPQRNPDKIWKRGDNPKKKA